MDAARRAAIRQRMAVIREALDLCVPQDPPWQLIDEALALVDELLVAGAHRWTAPEAQVAGRRGGLARAARQRARAAAARTGA